MGPKSGKSDPKIGQNGSKIGKMTPKSGKNDPKIGKKSRKSVKNHPQMSKNRSEMAQKWAKNGDFRPKNEAIWAPKRDKRTPLDDSPDLRALKGSKFSRKWTLLWGPFFVPISQAFNRKNGVRKKCRKTRNLRTENGVKNGPFITPFRGPSRRRSLELTKSKSKELGESQLIYEGHGGPGYP